LSIGNRRSLLIGHRQSIDDRRWAIQIADRRSQIADN
jgi:hypothetical protein